MSFFVDNNTKTIWKLLEIESMEFCLDKIPRKGNILVCGVCEGKRILPYKDNTVWNYSTLHNYSDKYTIVCPNCVCLVGPDNINMDDTQVTVIDINEICVNEYSTMEYDNIYEYRGIDPNSVSFRPVIYLDDDRIIYTIKEGRPIHMIIHMMRMKKNTFILRNHVVIPENNSLLQDKVIKMII